MIPPFIITVTLVNTRSKWRLSTIAVRRLRAVTVKGIPAAKKIFPRMRKKGDGARKRKIDPMMKHRPLPRAMFLSVCSWEHLQ